MQQYQRSFIKNITIGVILLSTTSLANVKADNVEEAAARVLQGFKFAKSQPTVQAPATAMPVQAITPQPTSPAAVAPTPAAPVEDAIPAADAQEAALPATLTLEADGSGIPGDSAGEELEASAGTGDEGTGNGSMDTAT